MKNKDVLEKLTVIFQEAMRDVESLADFYYRSNKTLMFYRYETEKEYLPGKIIGDTFEALFDISDLDERNKRIDEVSILEIEEGIKISDVCEIKLFEEESKNVIQFYMKEPYKNNASFDPKEAKRRYAHIEKYEYILNESILSHIIVAYERFLSDIYYLLINISPLAYFENQTILLADVFKDNFDEAIHNKLKSEVDNKMRDSLETLSIIENKEQIVIDRYNKCLKAFQEIYYRRNSYIHTAGRVNKDYLNKAGVDYTKGVNEDDKLICDDIYIKNAIETLVILIFQITNELLIKYDGSEKYVDEIANYFFERFKLGEYKTAKVVYYALSQNVKLPFRNRLMYRINYINAAKQLNESKLVSDELKKLDVTASTEDFIIAKACLLNENENVYKMLIKTYPNSFDSVAIREWPLFIQFRETEFYQKFVDLHASDFEIKQMDNFEELQ